jgi:CRP/FNR family cyclic AMP-dependent transcriptional regulator
MNGQRRIPGMNGERVRRGLIPKRRRPKYLERLSAVRLFSDCTVKELQRIDALTFEILVPAGRELVHVGETHQQCFVIASGVAAVHLNGRVLVEWGPSECFGDTRDPTPARASVSAATPMRLYVMSPREVQTLIVDVPSVGRNIVLDLARPVVAASGSDRRTPAALASVVDFGATR